jgi:hypothetical protein
MRYRTAYLHDALQYAREKIEDRKRPTVHRVETLEYRVIESEKEIAIEEVTE